MDRIEPLLSELQKDISLARLYIVYRKAAKFKFFPGAMPV